MIPKRKYHKRGDLIHGILARSHPMYARHQLMLRRCYDSKDPAFKNYGARGITVCDTWFVFKNYATDMGLPPSEFATVERVNNDGNYEPGNCAWVDRTQQCLNRRTFKNNTSGERGVIKIKNRFAARYDEYGTRFNLGRFDTVEEAKQERDKFITMLHEDPEQALLMTKRQARLDSKTGVRGISKRGDGYYTVRTTVNKVRVYHGCAKTLKEALLLLESVNEN